MQLSEMQDFIRVKINIFTLTTFLFPILFL